MEENQQSYRDMSLKHMMIVAGKADSDALIDDSFSSDQFTDDKGKKITATNRD